VAWWDRLRKGVQHLMPAARQAAQSDFEGELQACLDLVVERYRAQGNSPAEAQRQARLEFGDLEQIKDHVCFDRPGGSWRRIARDFRYAGRAVRRNPGLTAAAVLTLGLGIGVTAAIFSVVDAVLLEPFPYPHADRLSLIWSDFEKTGAERAPTSGIALREIGKRSQVFADVAGIWASTGTLTGSADPEVITIGNVTPNFLAVLGVQPELGRLFSPEERAGGRRAIVLTHGLWERRFGADRSIIGKAISLQGQPVTVVGVLPSRFRLLFPADANVPVDVQAFSPFTDNIEVNPVTLYYIRVLGRLRPGVTAPQAQADLDAVAAGIRHDYAELGEEHMKLDLAPLQGDAVRGIRRPLLSLLGGAGFVLLICCVNLANLHLASAHGRRKEIALRSALGAGGSGVLRQLFLEGLLTCALAGALGTVVAAGAIRGLRHIAPIELSRLPASHLSASVMLVVIVAALGATLLCGFAPGLGLRGLRLAEALREAGHATAAPRLRKSRSVLIVAEVTLGFVLVVSASLLVRSSFRLAHVDPGFAAQGLLTFDVSLASQRKRALFVPEYESRLAALPGVQAIGSVSHLPLGDYPNWYGPYRVSGGDDRDGKSQAADSRAITPGYFPAMGTRLLAGRFFDRRDSESAPQVAIVDEVLARSAWPGRSAIGQRIECEHFTKDGILPVWSQVVGVVEHLHNHSLATTPRGEVYLPFAQSPREHVAVVIRTAVSPLSLVSSVRKVTSAMNPQLGLGKVQPMTFYVDRALAAARFTAWLAGVFGGLGLLLAGIGLYSVISYSVSWRTREMGVRMALGAARSAVQGLVFGEALTLAGIGIVLGTGGALLVSRALESLVYGIRAVDPVSYGVAVGAVVVASVAGCWRPARRAALSDPVEALRS
jgi:putative ABC transport system permease protein